MDPTDRARLVRLATVAVVLVAIGGFALAASRTKTGERPVLESGAPDIVELLQPPSGNQVLRQAQIGIDLAAGWTGVLIVNGTEIPESQLLRRPELNQVFFSPQEGAVIETLPAGRNCVVAEIWRVELSPRPVPRHQLVLRSRVVRR